MATLKFLKVASKVKLRDLSVPHDNSGDLTQLKEEVRFLKDVLHMKRFGGGFSELAYKVKALEKENGELKKRILPQDRIHLILQQNLNLKKQLTILNLKNSLQDQERAKSSHYIRETDGQSSSIGPARIGSGKKSSDSESESNHIEDYDGNNLRPTQSEEIPTRIQFSDKLPSIKSPKGSKKNQLESFEQTETEHLKQNPNQTGSDDLSPLFPRHHKNNYMVNTQESRKSGANKAANSRYQLTKDLTLGFIENAKMLKKLHNPVKVMYNSHRLSQNSSRRSPNQARDYQGILDLIEDHIARKSDSSKLMKSNTLTNLAREASNRSGTNQNQPIGSHHHSQRNKDIFKQIQLITNQHARLAQSPQSKQVTKTLSELDQKESPRIFFNLTPSRVLKVSFKNSSQPKIKPEIPQNDARFSINKYENSLRNIKRQMDRINFE